MKIILIILVITFGLKSSFALTYSQWGDYLQFVPTATLLGTNIYEKNYELLRPQAYSYASTMAVVFTLKNTLNTTRPNGGKNSFPSGHTASAFLGVYPLYKKYGWKVGAPAGIIATIVAHSRVQGNFHHVRDVIASAILSLSSDYYFFKNKINADTTVSITLNRINLSYRY